MNCLNYGVCCRSVGVTQLLLPQNGFLSPTFEFLTEGKIKDPILGAQLPQGLAE